MPITDEERRTGKIHLTSGRDASSPATHVLVVGAGAYPKADLSPLTSPIASAKAVTGWFLGKGADGITAIEDGFRNDRSL